METPPTQIQSPQNFSYPNQIREATQAMASLTKLLLESSSTLSTLRREFRGEALYQKEDGSSDWVQISKPIFVKTEPITEEPLMKNYKMSDGEIKKVFIPNDEAIEEILSMLKFAGINQVTPITNIDENNILDDLREFECKLAAVLCLKQKEWGIDKEMLPVVQFKIKTIVQDARFMCREGTILKALQTTVSRVEQTFEGEKQKRGMVTAPYT